MLTFLPKVDQSKINPQLMADLHQAIDPLPDHWEVTYGFRTWDEQNALYQKHLAGGPVAAPPGNSPHEFGLAVDVVLVEPNGKTNYNVKDPRWQAMLDAVYAHPRLHSLKSIGDYDHIEAVNWRAHVGTGK